MLAEKDSMSQAIVDSGKEKVVHLADKLAEKVKGSLLSIIVEKEYIDEVIDFQKESSKRTDKKKAS